MKNQDPVKTRILEYTITFGICLFLCFIYCIIAGIFSDFQAVANEMGWNLTNNTAKTFFILTNASFTVGVVCACIGLLVVASNGGAFEMLVYGISRFFSLFKKDPTKVRFKTFYDYHVYRSGEPNQSFAFLLIIGGFYILISLLFLFLYYKFN